jgi:hypothetical protein
LRSDNAPRVRDGADALELHAAIIDGTTNQAVALLRSGSALEGALARTARRRALAHGIAESQAFLDGNKRLALVAMLTFLEANGYRVEATDRRFESVRGLFWMMKSLQIKGICCRADNVEYLLAKEAVPQPDGGGPSG